MSNYNYLKSVKEDVLEYIKNEVNFSDFDTIEELEERLNDDLWVEDSITGNASGSYTFNRSEAEKNVSGNMALMVEACKEFCVEDLQARLENEDFEYIDVTIRCYLLGQAIGGAMEEIEGDFNEAHEESSEEEEL